MAFFSDVKAVEDRVRAAMQDGPVTPYYALPLDKVYDVLNGALASEIVCVLRYKQHYYMTTSIHQEDHADEIADLLYTIDPETGKTVEQFTGDSTFKRDNFA